MIVGKLGTPLLAVALLLAASAHADTGACQDAFAAAPSSVRDGRFVAARQALQRCSADSCPAAMRPLCLEDLRQLEPRIPSVVFEAKSSDGRDRVNVRVMEGDRVLVEKLDGRGVDLDPGMHTFRFELSGSAPVVTEVLLHEGEKARPIVATLVELHAESPTLATPEPKALPVVRDTGRPIPWTVYAAGGIALATSAAWAYFGIDGISERSALGSCIGHCDPGSVQTATDHLYAADVFMAVSLAGWAGATALFLTRPKVMPTVATTREGVVCGIAGTF
jgi:hypothetical protein